MNTIGSGMLVPRVVLGRDRVGRRETGIARQRIRAEAATS